jgi:hypothetical protein
MIDLMSFICGHSNGASPHDVHPLLVYTTWLGLYSKWQDSICRARLVQCSSIVGEGTERTLSKLLEQQRSSQISIVPSIHKWGGETDFTWDEQQALANIHHADGIVIQHSLPRALFFFWPDAISTIPHAYGNYSKTWMILCKWCFILANSNVFMG